MMAPEAAVVKDGTGFTLEGGAMVLADNGLALALDLSLYPSIYVEAYYIYIYTHT